MMFGSILVLFVLPWLDTSPVRSARFRPIYRQLIWLLGAVVRRRSAYCGAHKPEGIWVVLGRVAHALLLPALPGDPADPRQAGAAAAAAREHQPAGPRRTRRRRTAARRRHSQADGESVMRTLRSVWPACCGRSPACSRLAGARRRRSPTPPKQNWSFDGPFGTFDLAAAQRGFQVYSEVCSNCHSMKLLHYRDLSGIGLNAEQIKAIAAGVTVPQGTGRPGQPEGRPGDAGQPVPSPFANEKAARAANNGALPPDLSLIVNAREGGAELHLRHPDRLSPTRRPGSRCRTGCTTTRCSPAIRSPCRSRCRTAGDLRRRHARQRSTRKRTTSSPSCPGRPTRKWRSASRWACASSCSWCS